MTTWTNDELNRIGSAEELEIAPLRSDGTLRKPTTIWVVRVDNDLYVRSVNGRDSAWFKGTQIRRYAESIINSIVSPTARSATLKLVPR